MLPSLLRYSILRWFLHIRWRVRPTSLFHVHGEYAQYNSAYCWQSTHIYLAYSVNMLSENLFEDLPHLMYLGKAHISISCIPWRHRYSFRAFNKKLFARILRYAEWASKFRRQIGFKFRTNLRYETVELESSFNNKKRILYISCKCTFNGSLTLIGSASYNCNLWFQFT